MKALSILAVAFVLSFTLPIPLVLAGEAEIPTDIVIIPPGSDVPPERARFSGIWYGTWYGARTGAQMTDHLIVVEEYKGEVVRVTSVLAAEPLWQIYGVKITVEGSFLPDGSLKLVFPSGTSSVYTLRKGALLGTFYGSRGELTATMKKVR